MAYYDVQSWQAPARQPSWDQPAPPSRSGASSVMSREEPTAFGPQLEEVDRALDNLAKSGKLFNSPSRRDPMPLGGASRFSEFDHRMGGGPSRHHSVTDFDPMRSHSASNLQNFYANQRHQPRHSEADQMQQAKRRMAAQRERELRNYHQEQQYNRKVSTQGKSERSISPNTMNEEERRELIARQHRALYGNERSFSYDGGNFGDDSSTPRPSTQQSNAGQGRGPSPLAYNSFGMPTEQKQAEQTEQNAKGPSPKPRSRANSNSSPASNNQSFSLFDSAAQQQSSRTSTSSPGGSPPRQSKTSGVAPIGTRPAQNQAVNPALNKRSTPPISSPLSYGFAPNESAGNGKPNERSTSAASNPIGGSKENNNSAWGSSSGGVWGKNPLGPTASVWG